MTDPRNPGPRQTVDPAHPDDARVMPQAPYTDPAYRDPAADPRIANQTIVQPSRGYGGIVAAGIIAALLVVAVIAFSTQPGTDPGTTAVIPQPGTEESAPAPAPEAAPAQPSAPALEEQPAAPQTDAPPANQ